MAEAARKEYKYVPIDICYCSPLIRAKETADIFLKGRDIPIVYDDRLKEMGFGIYEGVENSFSIPGCPVNEFFYHPEKYIEPVEGGESLDNLFGRTGAFLDEVVYPQLAEGKNILIIGHGAMNSAIVCRIKFSGDRSRFWEEGIPNCKLIQLI